MVARHKHWNAFRAGLILCVAGALCGEDNVLTPAEKSAGWVLLFDGKTLNGWDSSAPVPPSGGAPGVSPKKAKAPGDQRGGAPAQGSNPRPCTTPLGAPVPAGGSHWEIVAGALSPCGDIAGYLTSKASFKDLVLAIDFRTGEDTNSGVFIRSPARGNLGYEVQIWKAQPAGYNTGSIVGAGKTARDYRFLPDQWNHYEITAHADHLVVVLNGTRTLDIHDSRFSEGRIRLQYQKFPIEFKNVKVREIKP